MQFVLTLSCPDVKGIVHAVSGFLVENSCNILDSMQYGDTLTGTFCMRVHFAPENVTSDLEALRAAFGTIAKRFRMSWQLHDLAIRPRVMILVSKYDHCLNDLLYRHRKGSLAMDIPAVVSKGARPYHQAHERGVKLIGATAHYVTAALDEGPIIEQDVARVDHSMTPDDLAAVGRDIEQLVLARAVRYEIEHRLILVGGRTVVFR